MTNKPYKEYFYVLVDDELYTVKVIVYDIVDYLFNVGGKFLQKQTVR